MRSIAVTHRLLRCLDHSNKMDLLQHWYSKFFGATDETVTTDNKLRPRKVVAFGNILLDYTAHLKDTQLLDRYQLSLNSRAEIDVEILTQITTDAMLSSQQKEPHLGGSALNTIRILQKMGTNAMFFGAVGNDKRANIVRDLLRKEGLDLNYFKFQTIIDTPTGSCICLVYENSLALYANIGASSKFSVEFLQQLCAEEGNWFIRGLDRKQLFYIEGFFVPQRENVITYIVRNYIQGCHRLVLNLSATYIVKLNYHYILYLAHHAHFIFGNKDEFDTFCECWGANSIEELAECLTKSGEQPKIIIITNGAEPVQMITNFVDEFSPPGELTYQTFNTQPVENVVDTTGCGDAFAAAFLHGWLEERSLNECIRLACIIAAKVASEIGCNIR